MKKNMDNFLRIHDVMEEKVMKIVMRYIGNNYHVAQEITQDVFLKLYESFDSFEEDYLIQWLYVTTKNQAKDYLKREAKVEITPVYEIVEVQDAWEYMPSAEDEVFETIQYEETIAKAHYLMDFLYETNERWYETMRLSYFENLHQSEAAERLGVSTKVIQDALYRAKKKIRTIYESEDKIL